MKKLLLYISILLSITTSYSYAAHPLITDDTGTQGKGKFQLEFNTEYGVNKENGVTEKNFEFAPIISYGVTDTIDIVLSVPYQRSEIEDIVTTKQSGVSDMSLEAKWRFFEKNGLSFAIKPGISIPTGEEDKGLGAGKFGYSVYLIATKEAKPINLHLNLGYIRNENEFDERENIIHTSLAGELEVTEKLKIVANIGAETNADKSSNVYPAFALMGAIYSITENLSVDVGYKYGLNKPETDNTYLFGIALKF